MTIHFFDCNFKKVISADNPFPSLSPVSSQPKADLRR